MSFPAMSTVPNWSPRSAAQAAALSCPAQMLLFGGAAGSLKSETMLIDAVLERDNPRLRAILFRRSFPELEKSLIRRSRELYPGFGAVYNEQKKRWRFPSGALVEFGYCESEKDMYAYQGAQYSFLGFDESTHFVELTVRYLTSRLRSTDPTLFLRLRLGTNPGNVGHVWHRNLFQGPKCTHCEVLPGAGRLPNELYTDARWPSDGQPVRKSTCFIPGRIHDHSLLGSGYLDTLAALPGSYRKALLEGCWAAFEGQFFDTWDAGRMVVPRSEIEDQLWWPCWVGADYGFNVSQAAAYLLTRSAPSAVHPAGRTYVISEYTARHETAVDFARSLWTCFATRDSANSERRVQAWYLSPDAWSQRGDGRTLADQMAAASRIAFEPASNDRVGGAMLLYTQLDSGELVIADSCRQLIEALPTRVHDPHRPDDILKVAGDPLDDCVDALRYGVYSWFGPARKPEAAALEQAMTSADPTVAMLQRRLAEERLKVAGRGRRYLGSRAR